MDDLSKVLNHISISADVFFSGKLCGMQVFGGRDAGHLHILESGSLTIMTEEGHKIRLTEPSVIFIPSATLHRIISKESDSAVLICAAIKFDAGNHDQLINSLPKFISFKLSENEYVGKTAQWLFYEAFNEESGRQMMLDKLSDIFLLQVLRYVLKNGLLSQGIFAGLTHPQLAVVVNAINAEPEKQWSVERLAELAAMSRSKFASVFKETIGQPPNDYITDLRVSIAQNMLKLDKPVSLIANEVGYEHGSALARVFRKKLGLSPKEWLQKIKVK